MNAPKQHGDIETLSIPWQLPGGPSTDFNTPKLLYRPKTTYPINLQQVNESYYPPEKSTGPID